MSRQQIMNNSMAPNTGKRRRVRFLFFVILCLLVWAAVTIGNQAGNFKLDSIKLNEVMLQQADVLATNVEMKKEVARLNDPEYREEIFRKQLHFGKTGETTFEIPK